MRAPGPLRADVESVLALLDSAQRPLLLAGVGASPDCARALVELAHRTGALVGTTLLAKGRFAGCRYDVGVVGGYATDPSVPVLADIDLVLAFGASLSPYTTGHGTLFRRVPIVQVEADPDRIGERTPVQLGVVADAESVAEALLAAVSARAPRSDPPLHRPALLAALRAPACAEPDESTADELDPRAIAITLDELLPSDRVLVMDSGRFSTAPGRFVDVRNPPAIRHTADGGSIGLGLGVALGAAYGRPQRTTVLFAGDGGFSMAMADLETAARHRIPLVVVVLDDRAYGSELGHLRAVGLPSDLALLPGIDFAGVSRALGIEAVTVRSSDELRELGPRLSARRDPLLIHCLIRRDVVVPRISWGPAGPTATLSS
jgi:thiamine pyrophosphate-dependent acetolactate synthase large subunit-like protein